MRTMNLMDFVHPGPLVGFLWRCIPIISQHKIALESLCPDSFDRWSNLLLNRYNEELVRFESQLVEQSNLLEKEGVERLYVAPEAIGSIKLKVVHRLLKELSPGTFILVPSWGNLGSRSIVGEIVNAGFSQNRFFILPSQKSLMHIHPSEIKQAYQSWVIASIENSYVSVTSRRDQILSLQEQGWSPEEIQVELGISKSTYYRQLESPIPAVNRRKQIIELYENGLTPTEIQARLGISSSTYYRIMEQVAFSDSSGNVISPKQEK